MKKFVLILSLVIVTLVIIFFLVKKPVSESLNNKAVELYKAGDFKAAGNEFERALQWQKSNFNARVNLVRAQLQLLEFTQAEENINTGSEIFPDSAVFVALNGQLLVQTKNYAKAILLLDQAIAKDPDMSFAYYYRGIARANQNDLEGAAEDYKKVQELDKGNIEALEQRALIMGEMSNFREAIENYSQILALDPENREALAHRGNFKLEIEDFEGAIDDFSSSLRLDPNQPEICFNRGKAYAQINSLDEAINDFQQAAKMNYKLSSSYFNTGLAYLKLNDFKNAVKSMDNALASNPDSSRSSEIHQLLGVIYLNQNNFPSALKHFNTAIEFNKLNSTAFYNRGIAFGLQKDYLKAIDDLEISRKLGNNSADLFYALGANKIAVNNFDGGCADLKKAASLGSTSAVEMRKQYCTRYE